MSTRAATRTARSRPRSRPGPRRPRSVARRRRLAVALVLTLASAGGLLHAAPWVDKAVQEIALPLRHEDIIRQQARDKGLDPALIAGVIYVESRFRDQTSHAGAKGLMQIMPATAEYIADKSGGTAFVQGDLANPQVNISYGSWYLRYLLGKYGGSETLALAAYNAGEGKVDEWVVDHSQRGESFRAERIPFRETRDYVRDVLAVRDRYRVEYAPELGL